MAKCASVLREIRTRLRLTQAECAAALGVAVETFRTWDAGRRTDTASIAVANPSASWGSVMPAEAVVEATSLAKSYGELKALDEVSFRVGTGEIFGFIGADGAGKTTAFRIIAGVLAQGGGEVRVLGKTPREAGPRVGYLTQPFSLYQDMSVDENLEYAGGLRERAAQVTENPPSTYRVWPVT